MPDTPSLALSKLTEAHRMLSEVRTIPEALQIIDIAAAAQYYARKAKMGLETQNFAAEVKLRAERLAGEMLREVERGDSPHTGAPGPGRGNTSNGGQVSPYARTLDEAGATRQDAARWQKVAAFDAERFEQLIEEGKAAAKELTTAYLLRAWRREEKNEQPPEEASIVAVDDMQKLIASGVRFGTIYADPPWLYGNQATRGATGDHYPGMTPAEVAALPVRDVVADNAHLHLWTTNAFLFDAREVIESWGFTYKSCFVWVKPQMGMGNYWRVSHEFCLLGVRGAAPFGSHSEMSWREWPRGRHSAKPERMYELIEQVSPGPFLELFARRRREGWSSWGNGIESDLFFQEKVS